MTNIQFENNIVSLAKNERKQNKRKYKTKIRKNKSHLSFFNWMKQQNNKMIFFF